MLFFLFSQVSSGCGQHLSHEGLNYDLAWGVHCSFIHYLWGIRAVTVFPPLSFPIDSFGDYIAHEGQGSQAKCILQFSFQEGFQGSMWLWSSHNKHRLAWRTSDFPSPDLRKQIRDVHCKKHARRSYLYTSRQPGARLGSALLPIPHSR